MINCTVPVLSVDKRRVPVFPSSVSKETGELLLRRGSAHLGPPVPGASVGFHGCWCPLGEGAGCTGGGCCRGT